MRFKGLSKTKVLRTPEDVLEHSYGRKAEESAPLPAPVSTPEPTEPTEEMVEMTEEEYAASLVEGNKKDDLIEIAKGLGLDTDGTKADLAGRIAVKEYSEE